MHLYEIAELIVSSDVALTFAPKAGAFNDVDVWVKSVQQVPTDGEIRFHCTDARANADTIWFHSTDDLQFAVRGGHTIFAAAADHYNADDISLYINGSGMGAIAFHRGQIPFHISGVQLGSTMIAISGKSGAGKSTLATMLAQRGLAHFTDDVGVVDPNTNPLNVLPMPKGVKLEQDTARALGISVSHQVSKAFALEKKYADDLPQSTADRLQFGALYIISTDNAVDFGLREI